ncbi:CDKN2AIP-like protein [Cricetulus griseus]|nr:CDKN2AIP-like protein [Cricetulus griseus]
MPMEGRISHWIPWNWSDSYNKDLLDKVMEMADGIEVEDLPQFTTRSELMKKVQSLVTRIEQQSRQTAPGNGGQVASHRGLGTIVTELSSVLRLSFVS